MASMYDAQRCDHRPAGIFFLMLPLWWTAYLMHASNLVQGVRMIIRRVALASRDSQCGQAAGVGPKYYIWS